MRLLSSFTLLFLLFSCSAKNYQVISIPVGQEFVLGEMAKRNYSVNVKPVLGAPVTVEVVERSNMEVTQSYVVTEKQGKEVFMSQAEEIHFVNRGKEEVKVRLFLKEGVDGMEYRPLKSNQ